MFSQTSTQKPSTSTTNAVQASQQSTPRVFVAADGSPLPIFVDSNGVTNNRPKLIRTLRSTGAQICTDVSRARILLVDPGTNEGRQFVRDWSLDPGKTILDYVWAYRSIDAGHALLENDNWGGLGGLDGSPIDGGDIDDEDRLEGPSTSRSNRVTTAKPKKPLAQLRNSPQNGVTSSASSSSLPTPRPTPSSNTPISPQVSQHQTMPSATEDSKQRQNGQTLPPPIATYNPPPAPQYLPQQSPPPHMQVHQSTHNMHPNLPMPPPSLYDMPPGSQQYPNSLQQHTTNIMGYPPEVLQTAAMMIFHHQMPNFVGMNGTHPMNVVGGPYNGPQSWPGILQPAASMLPPQAYPSSMSPTQQPFHPTFLNGASTLEEQGRMTSPPLAIKSEPVSLLPSIATKLDRSSPSPTLSDEERSVLTQKAKRRSSDTKLPLGPNSKRAKREPEARSASLSNIAEASSSHSGHKKRSSKHGLPDLQIESLSRPEPSQKPSTIGIFTDPDGQPMPFFVQVDMRNRVAVTSMVKKNGGKITAHIEEAAFIILTSQSKSTKALLKEVKKLKRRALQQDFVKACVVEGTIVDEEEFLFEPEPTAYERRRLEHARNFASKRSPSEPSIPHSTSRDRSPTPPTKIEEISGGRHAFTKEDKDYIAAYAAYLFRLDPHAALNVLIKRVSERAPSHSLASWQTTVYSAKDTLERIREEIKAEKRQVEEAKAEEDNVEEALGPSGNEASSGMERDVAELNHTMPELYEINEEINPADVRKDLKNIIEFFANAASDGVDDEQLWAELQENYKCRTCPTWQDFYEAQMDKVNQLLRQALAEKQAYVEQSTSIGSSELIENSGV